MYINELGFDQISFINIFLKDRNMPIMGATLICQLNQVTSGHSDALMLSDADIYLRGEIVQIRPESNYYGVMVLTSETPESAYKAYLENFEKEREKYKPETFKSICDTHLKALQGSVPHYFLHLKTTGLDSVCNVLLLNAEYLPLADIMIKTEYL